MSSRFSVDSGRSVAPTFEPLGGSGSVPVDRFGFGVEQEIHYLEKSAVEAFFRAIPPDRCRDRAIWDLVYRHALRRSELALLTLTNLRPDRIWIGRLKGSVSGEYPLHPSSRKLLAAYLPLRHHAESPYIFTSRQSRERPLSTSLLFRNFQGYARAAGIPEGLRHPHVLRHSMAVHLMNAGWDLADVQDWLGHKEIASTTIYTAVTNPRREVQYERALASGEIAETL